MNSKSGKIITFYSYKGGTGRTMANVGRILASNGYDVLLIDWDDTISIRYKEIRFRP
jgi:cellulose biosynthesis protein BcsQ